VTIAAVPSEVLSTSAELDAMAMGLTTSGMRPSPVPAPCTAPARLTESLPTAALPPLLATPSPLLSTAAFCEMRARPPGGSPPAEPEDDCVTLVSLALPVADAAPVWIVAKPPEVFAAVPEFDARPLPDVAPWRSPAALRDVLPTATLPPVLASASPLFVTSAF
jgi:hypothetical protein